MGSQGSAGEGAAARSDDPGPGAEHGGAGGGVRDAAAAADAPSSVRSSRVDGEEQEPDDPSEPDEQEEHEPDESEDEQDEAEGRDMEEVDEGDAVAGDVDDGEDNDDEQELRYADEAEDEGMAGDPRSGPLVTGGERTFCRCPAVSCLCFVDRAQQQQQLRNSHMRSPFLCPTDAVCCLYASAASSPVRTSGQQRDVYDTMDLFRVPGLCHGCVPDNARRTKWHKALTALEQVRRPVEKKSDLLRLRRGRDVVFASAASIARAAVSDPATATVSALVAGLHSMCYRTCVMCLARQSSRNSLR